MQECLRFNGRLWSSMLADKRGERIDSRNVPLCEVDEVGTDFVTERQGCLCQ